MDSCYSDEHIAGDHLHMDTTTCNTEEAQQKYRLEMASKRILTGAGGA